MQSLEIAAQEKEAERNHLTLDIHASIACLNIQTNERRTVRGTAEDAVRERERGLEVDEDDQDVKVEKQRLWWKRSEASS